MRVYNMCRKIKYDAVCLIYWLWSSYREILDTTKNDLINDINDLNIERIN